MADETSQKAQTISFDFIKSSAYRVVHADGAWGGLNVRGNIFMAFYVERPAIPTRITNAITPEGRLGEELSREQRPAVVREVEVGVVMDLVSAKSLHDWIGAKLEEAKELQATEPQGPSPPEGE